MQKLLCYMLLVKCICAYKIVWLYDNMFVIVHFACPNLSLSPTPCWCCWCTQNALKFQEVYICFQDCMLRHLIYKYDLDMLKMCSNFKKCKYVIVVRFIDTILMPCWCWCALNALIFHEGYICLKDCVISKNEKQTAPLGATKWNKSNDQQCNTCQYIEYTDKTKQFF